MSKDEKNDRANTAESGPAPLASFPDVPPQRDVKGRWIAGGPSPNPDGRPPRIKEAEDQLFAEFGPDMASIMRVQRSKALLGDTEAAKFLYDRLLGKARARMTGVDASDPVKIGVDDELVTILKRVAGETGEPDDEPGKE